MDCSSVLFDYDDPQLFGSWWRARAAVAQALGLDHQLLLGGDNGLHIDIAVPLMTQLRLDSVQLLVETRRSF